VVVRQDANVGDLLGRGPVDSWEGRNQLTTVSPDPAAIDLGPQGSENNWLSDGGGEKCKRDKK